jgi:hypothetical protein
MSNGKLSQDNLDPNMSSTVGWAKVAGGPILGSVGAVEICGVMSAYYQTGVIVGLRPVQTLMHQ